MRELRCFSLEKLDIIRKKILAIALAYLSIVASLALAHGDTTLVSTSVRSLFIHSQYFAIVLVLIFTYWRKVQKSSLLIGIPVFVYYIFYLFDSSPFLSVPLNLVVIIPLILISFQSYQIRLLAFLILYNFFILVSFLGIIASISFIFNLGIPYEIAPYYGSEDYYVNYHFAYLYWGGEEGLAFRLCGLCNEPGFFGTILALLLTIQKVNIKKIGNIILLIAGFFTFSAAFYAILFIFIFFMAIKKIKLWLAIIPIGVMLSITIQTIKTESDLITQLIERFEFDNKTGKFKGDNRTNISFDKAYEKLFDSTYNSLFGFGTNSHYKISNINADRYKVIIYQYGLVGFVLIYVFFFIIRGKVWLTNSNALCFTLLFLISIYQRPRIFMATYFLLYYGGIDYIAHSVRTKMPLNNRKKFYLFFISN